MSAKDKPISKPMNQQFADNYDRIFSNKLLGESNKPKDRIDLGLGPSTLIEEIDFRGIKK